MVLIKLSTIFILCAAAGAIIPVVALPTSWNKMTWHPWKERVDPTGPGQFSSGNIPENSNNPTGRVFLRIPNSNFDLARSTSKRRKQDYESSNKPLKMGPSAPPSHRTEIHPGPSSRRVDKSSDNPHRTKKGKQAQTDHSSKKKNTRNRRLAADNSKRSACDDSPIEHFPFVDLSPEPSL